MAASPPPPDSVSAPPSSLWPDTARLRAGGGLSVFEASRFDPLFDQKAQERRHLVTQFDLCRPAVALRVMLLVQWAVVVAVVPWAQGWADGLSRLTLGAFAGLAGSLLWLPLACALRPVLMPRSAVVRDSALVGLGAVSGLVGWGLLALPGLVPAQPAAGVGSALAGASLAWCVWRWLGLRATAAQPVEASARLAELQSRIRPHFLFNALNTALALVQVDPRKAEAMLEDLAQLFRVALAESGSAVTLHDEIDLAQRYLAIEKLRFGDRLKVVWDLDEAANHAVLPPLVLQPLVENAVRHGIEPSLRGGRVLVRTRVKRGMAKIEVMNTLSDEPGRPGAGIALANVAERLRLLHDVAATLETGVVEGNYRARIVVPL